MPDALAVLIIIAGILLIALNRRIAEMQNRIYRSAMPGVERLFTPGVLRVSYVLVGVVFVNGGSMYLAAGDKVESAYVFALTTYVLSALAAGSLADAASGLGRPASHWLDILGGLACLYGVYIAGAQLRVGVMTLATVLGVASGLALSRFRSRPEPKSPSADGGPSGAAGPGRSRPRSSR
jgi:hypothetical protein